VPWSSLCLISSPTVHLPKVLTRQWLACRCSWLTLMRRCTRHAAASDCSQCIDNLSGLIKNVDLNSAIYMQLGEVQRRIDHLHNTTFSNVSFDGGSSNGTASADAASAQQFDSMTEADFAVLGRDNSAGRKELLAAKDAAEPGSVQRFQSAVVPLRLQRTRLKSEIEDLQTAIDRLRAEAREAAELEGMSGSLSKERGACLYCNLHRGC
jgi:hypothetical protein